MTSEQGIASIAKKEVLPTRSLVCISGVISERYVVAVVVGRSSVRIVVLPSLDKFCSTCCGRHA